MKLSATVHTMLRVTVFCLETEHEQYGSFKEMNTLAREGIFVRYSSASFINTFLLNKGRSCLLGDKFFPFGRTVSQRGSANRKANRFTKAVSPIQMTKQQKLNLFKYLTLLQGEWPKLLSFGHS